MKEILVFLYYLLGLYITLGFFKHFKLGKPFINGQLTDKPKFLKILSDIKDYERSFQTWCYIGLLSSQWLVFIILLIFFYIFKLITDSKKFGWLYKPTLLNVTIYKTTKVTIAILTLFVILNHMHLDLPISKIIINSIFNN